MDLIKIAANAASVFLIVLFAFIFFIENPDQRRYDQMVESLMIHEGLSSEKEVLAAFPVLKKIQSAMERISYLKSSIHGIVGGPFPNVSKEEKLQLDNYHLEIRQLQENVEQELAQLETIYTALAASSIDENNQTVFAQPDLKK